jgi:hypothetical protein
MYEMNGTTKYDGEDHPVRKLLQSLPKIATRAGFELRLRKRLADQPKRTLWPTFVVARRIPAYSLSVLAVAAVGTVVYFAFLQTGITPVEQVEQPRDVQQEIPQQVPSLQPSHSAEGSDESKAQAAQEQQPAVAPSENLSIDKSSPSGTSSPPTEKQQLLPPPIREAIQDARTQRLLLKEAGGTGLRIEQPAETSGTPFLRPSTDASIEALYDSITRSDSIKQDSPKDTINRDQKINPHE